VLASAKGQDRLHQDGKAVRRLSKRSTSIKFGTGCAGRRLRLPWARSPTASCLEPNKGRRWFPGHKMPEIRCSSSVYGEIFGHRGCELLPRNMGRGGGDGGRACSDPRVLPAEDDEISGLRAQRLEKTRHERTTPGHRGEGAQERRRCRGQETHRAAGRTRPSQVNGGPAFGASGGDHRQCPKEYRLEEHQVKVDKKANPPVNEVEGHGTSTNV